MKNQEEEEADVNDCYKACCALNCSNVLLSQDFDDDYGYTFHPLPEDRERSNEWLRRAGRDDLIDKSESMASRDSDISLCSDHFEPGCYIKDYILRQDALPSLFSHDLCISATSDETNHSVDVPTYHQSQLNHYGNKSMRKDKDKLSEPGGNLSHKESFPRAMVEIMDSENDYHKENQMECNKQQGKNKNEIACTSAVMLNTDISKVEETGSNSAIEDEPLPTGEASFPNPHQVDYSWEDLPSQICRLCASENEAHPKQPIVRWMGLLNEIVPGLVVLDDDFPQYVCRPCLKKLYMAVRIKAEFIQADEKLRSIQQFSSHASNVEMTTSEMNDVKPEIQEEVICDKEIKQEVSDDDFENDKEVQETYNNDEMNNFEILNEASENARNSFEDSEGGHETANDSKEERSKVVDGDTESQGRTLENEGGYSSDCESNCKTEMEDSVSLEKWFKSKPLKQSVENEMEICVEDSTENQESDLTFICSECEKLFSTKKELLVHMKRHRNKATNVKKNSTGSEEDPSKYVSVVLANDAEDSQVPDPLKLSYMCRTCGNIYDTQEALLEHSFAHTEEKTELVCNVCGGQFLFRRDLIMHLRTHTNEKTYVCELCGKNFLTYERLKMHQLSHFPPRFSCTTCNKKFSNRITLLNHKKLHLRKQKFVCDICGESLKSKAVLEGHLHNHQGIRPYKCDLCGKDYPSQDALRYHKLRHRSARFFCEICGKGTKDRTAMKLHMSVHTKALACECPICLKSFANANSRAKHMKNSCKFMVCVVCNETFPSMETLKDHRSKEHTEDEIQFAAQEFRTIQVLKCNDCSTYIAGTHVMGLHMEKIHDVMEFVICDQCLLCFSDIEQHAEHIKSCTSEKVNRVFYKGKCAICNEVFPNNYNELTKHLRNVHRDYRPYICEVCEKGFLTKKELETHSFCHTEGGKYQCSKCSASFKSNRSLKSHEFTVHKTHFPFSCKYCGHKFRRQSTLITHERTHTGERPYVCPVCGNLFKQRGDMIVHTKKHFVIQKEGSS